MEGHHAARKIFYLSLPYGFRRKDLLCTNASAFLVHDLPDCRALGTLFLVSSGYLYNHSSILNSVILGEVRHYVNRWNHPTNSLAEAATPLRLQHPILFDSLVRRTIQILSRRAVCAKVVLLTVYHINWL